jgi:hypothetical protein
MPLSSCERLLLVVVVVVVAAVEYLCVSAKGSMQPCEQVPRVIDEVIADPTSF